MANDKNISDFGNIPPNDSELGPKLLNNKKNGHFPKGLSNFRKGLSNFLHIWGSKNRVKNQPKSPQIGPIFDFLGFLITLG